MIRSFVSLRNWGPSFYLSVFLFLLAVNLFSPKGIIHWVLMKQEAERLRAKISLTEHELQAVQTQKINFSSSDTAKLRAIREGLGLLKNDEISIEFTDSKK